MLFVAGAGGRPFKETSHATELYEYRQHSRAPSRRLSAHQVEGMPFCWVPGRSSPTPWLGKSAVRWLACAKPGPECPTSRSARLRFKFTGAVRLSWCCQRQNRRRPLHRASLANRLVHNYDLAKHSLRRRLSGYLRRGPRSQNYRSSGTACRWTWSRPLATTR